jgi:hypothetical protein
LENVIVPSERNCPPVGDGALLNVYRLIYSQAKSKLVVQIFKKINAIERAKDKKDPLHLTTIY